MSRIGSLVAMFLNSLISNSLQVRLFDEFVNLALDNVVIIWTPVPNPTERTFPTSLVGWFRGDMRGIRDIRKENVGAMAIVILLCFRKKRRKQYIVIDTI